jgi:PAS domain-containing protein
VVSGMSVIIGDRHHPFGILGSHTTARRCFTSDDVHFLQSMANILATTITRKRVEENLKTERQRFLSLLEELPAYVYLQAPDYSIPFANRYFRERFGDPEERPCYQVMWDHKEPCKECPTFQVFETPNALQWEWVHAPSGHVYQIFDYPFTDVDGSPLVLELGIDITERKQAEKAIKLEKERVQVYFNTAAMILMVLNPDETVAQINRHGSDILGCEPKQIVGKNWFDNFLPESCREQLRRGFKDFVHGKVPRKRGYAGCWK